MKKLKLLILVTIFLAATLLLQVLFGPFLSAKISTMPFVRKFNLVRPTAPIVIHTREEVRVSDTEDVVAVFNKIKSRLSTVLLVDGTSVKAIASAVTISGDGVFMTVQGGLRGLPQEKLVIRLPDGTVGKVQGIAFDPASSLAVLKADITNAAPVSFADSSALNPGERVVLAAMGEMNPVFFASFVSFSEEISGIHSSDQLSRGFGIGEVPGLISGHAIIDMDGDVSGLWDGAKVVPAGVLKTATTSYFANGGSIVRSAFGFNSVFISESAAALLAVPSGARVSPAVNTPAVISGSSADKAGLREGDIIVEVAGVKITQSANVEHELEKLRPGEQVRLQVIRGTETKEIILVANQLQ